MPELPEVETTRRGLLTFIKGRTITGVSVRNRRLRWPTPRNLKSQLTDKILRDISRRGKYLLFTFDNGHMIVHLGMSGSLRISDASAQLRKHDHLIWQFSDNRELRYHDPRRFGSVHWTTNEPSSHSLLSGLGVEPLSEEFNGEYLLSAGGNRKVAVKNFIMNSHIVVGVGNIYANEALFVAGIHPKRPVNSLNPQQFNRLSGAIKNTLDAAIQQGGTTLRDFVNESGNPGYFYQQLRVYDRKNQPCKHCGKKIEMEVIGQRASYFCPNCQS